MNCAGLAIQASRGLQARAQLAGVLVLVIGNDIQEGCVCCFTRTTIVCTCEQFPFASHHRIQRFQRLPVAAKFANPELGGSHPAFKCDTDDYAVTRRRPSWYPNVSTQIAPGHFITSGREECLQLQSLSRLNIFGYVAHALNGSRSLFSAMEHFVWFSVEYRRLKTPKGDGSCVPMSCAGYV